HFHPIIKKNNAPHLHFSVNHGTAAYFRNHNGASGPCQSNTSTWVPRGKRLLWQNKISSSPLDFI
ncbi:hypothetical protein ACQP3J_31140, partial [Escherichia coli]